jgi:hypothetical protein
MVRNSTRQTVSRTEKVRRVSGPGRLMKLGLERVGSSLGDRLRWLQEFAARPLGRAHDEDVENARWEVLAFSVVPPSGLKGSSMPDGLENFTWFLGEPSGRQPLLDDRRVLSTLRRMQEDTRRMMADLRERGYCDPNVTIDWLGWDRGRLTIESRTGHAESYQCAVMATLLQPGDRLKTCANARCGRFFVKIDRRSFCTPACENRARARRYARNNPKRVADMKHESYVKKVRAQPGRGSVKVDRRPRQRDQGGILN